MKNHFYIPYNGNKREEVERIEEYIKDYITDETIFIEPFCGSCALSYYIWTKYPNLEFILNDESDFLFEMYNLLKNEEEIDKLEKYINEAIENMDKEKYTNILKEKTLYSKFLGKKFYNIREGLFPMGKNLKKINLRNCGIYNFFKNANITYTKKNAIDIIEQNNFDKNAIIFLDPPYINTTNTYYNYDTKENNNVYEYLYRNSINDWLSTVIGVFESNWIINLLYKENIINEYKKIYQIGKKKTIHILISNKI